MLRCIQLAAFILLVWPVAPLYSQNPAPWKDPSPHTTQFVGVGENVRLEVLDWGGSGKPIVLLAGGGNTAHVFDEFAPKLTADYHVTELRGPVLARPAFQPKTMEPKDWATTYWRSLILSN